MARKQRYSGEPQFYETTLDATSTYPPSSKAVAEAMTSKVPEIVAGTAFEAIYMSANEKVYEISVDAEGKLACAEVEEESEG